MSTNPTDPQRPTAAGLDEPTRLLYLEEHILLYEPRNPSAWIRTDGWVELAERR